MLAVIKTGGKQYTVEEGTILNVELLGLEEDASTYTFDDVLMVAGDGGIQLGKPLVEGAKVQAEIMGFAYGEKLMVFKKKRRKDYRKRTGHRQAYAKVKITNIMVGSEG